MKKSRTPEVVPSTTQPMSVVDLLKATNHWSAWLDEDLYGPISTWRLAAVLLRDLPVETLINRLAPALLRAEAGSRREIAAYLRKHPLPGDVVFGFEHWLEIWHRQRGMNFRPEAEDILMSRDGSPDLRLFAEVAAHPDTQTAALLWFVLGGIQEWKQAGGDLALIDADARWLVDLYSNNRADWEDPLEVLFAFLYKRLHASRARKSRPLPGAMQALGEVYEPIDDHSATATSTEIDVLSYAAKQEIVWQQEPRLEYLLGGDSRAWPKVASDISALRTRGLMEQNSFAPTAEGLGLAEIKWTHNSATVPSWVPPEFPEPGVT